MNAENFHGHIALPLETICRLYMSNNNISIPINADGIESGDFAASMTLILCHKYKSCMPEEVVTFLKSCLDLFGMSGSAMHFSDANTLFSEFKKHMKA